jgi:hypothetical protein
VHDNVKLLNDERAYCSDINLFIESHDGNASYPSITSVGGVFTKWWCCYWMPL